MPLQLNIVDGADRPLRCVRVLAKEVQVNAVSLKLEHISFMLCPRDRVVRVLLPIKTTNEELNPNRKSGAFAYVTMRRVLYACLGSSVPPHIEVDVSKLALGEVVRVRDLPQPPGTKILHHWPDDGVVKCISATASAE